MTKIKWIIRPQVFRWRDSSALIRAGNEDREMVRLSSIARLIGIVIGTFATTAAWAQFPSTQDGHALDSSSQLGAHGRNLPVTGTATPINYGNLIVTGNVTQGRAFRGYSPIRDISSFGTNLPSAGLSTFARDSVSAGEFARGGTSATVIAPQTFFSVEQTVPTAGAVAHRLFTPTDSFATQTYPDQHVSYLDLGQTPYSTTYQSLQDTRIINRGTSLRPEVLTEADAPVGTHSAVNPMLLRSQLLATNRGLADRTPSTDLLPYSFDSQGRLNDSGLMGGPDMDEIGLDEATRNSLAGIGGQQPRQVLSSASPNGAAPTAASAEDLRRAQQPLDLRLQMQLDQNGVYQVATPSTPGSQNATSMLPTPQDNNAVPQPTGARVGQNAVAGPPNPTPLAPVPQPGMDTGELMRSLQPQPVAAGEPEAPIEVRRPVIGQFEQPTAEPPNLVAGNVQSQGDLINPGGPEPSKMLNQPVKTLAGEKDTRLNEYLHTAEKYLKQEQYYRAAALYEMATMIDPKNPLCWLGHGNALIAAGDYRSAIRSLLRGIELFDEIGSFQMDLHDFIPDASLLESRRASLEAQLKGRENPETRFLLGYIEYYSGLKTFGLTDLQKAAADAPPDSIIAKFPDKLGAATGAGENR